jgi:hypothetical protein
MKKNALPSLPEFLSRFKESKDYVIGLDRGTEAIRYVVTNIKTNEIVEWGSSSVGKQKPTSKGSKKETHPSPLFLKDLARQYPRMRVQKVRCNLRDPAVVSGNVEISDEGVLNQDKVRLAISGDLTYKLEDTSYAYHKISMDSQGSDKSSKKSWYHYVSVPKGSIPSMLRPVEESLLIVPSLIPEGEIHKNLVAKLKLDTEGGMIAVINIGRSTTSISVINDSQVIFQRDIPLAGQDLTRAIFVSSIKERSADQTANLSKAEEIKKQIHLSHDQREEKQQPAYQSMTGVLSAWINDIKLSLNHFKGIGENSIKKIYLIGGGANLKGLTDYMKQELGIETGLLELTEDSSLKIAPKLKGEEFKKLFHEYAAAASLANMPRDAVDLTPAELRGGPMERLAEIFIRSCPILIGAVLLTWFVFLTVQSNYLQNNKSVLEEQQIFLSKVEKPYIEMIRWERFLNESDSSSALTSKLLMAVSQLIPPNVLVEKANLNRTDGSMRIQGTVHGDAKKRAITMAQFSKSLTDCGYFSNVKTSITRSTKGQNVEGRFKLTSKLRVRK